MNETFNIQGIVLKREDFREVDSRVLVYGLEKGLMELIVRGTKKIKSKLAGHIEPISLVEIMVIKGKTYDYVGSALAVDSFRGIKEDYGKIMTAGAVLRRMSEVIKAHEIDEDIFALLYDFLKILNVLNGEIHDTDLLVNFYILKFMSILGYRPNLEECLVCGTKELASKMYFNAKKGGLECGECFISEIEERKNSFLISLETIDLLKAILQNNFNIVFKFEISEQKQKEINNVVSSFEEFHLK